MKKIAFAFAFALAFAAFVSCSSIEDDPSSSSGNNGDSSSSIGGGDGTSSGGGDGNSSIGGGEGSSSSGGGDGNSSSAVSGGNSSSNVSGGNSSSSVGGGNSSSGGTSANQWTDWPFDSDGENLQASPDCPSQGTPIEIKYNNGGSPDVTNPYAGEVSVTNSGEHVTVNLGAVERNLLLSGTAQNGSLKVYGNERVGLYLNGVRITNSSGPAINIQRSRRVSVCLVSGKENYLDGASALPQGDEQAKGAFFSEKKLDFTGSGSLEVKARQGQGNGHAIVVDNDFEMDNGKIIISEAYGDGIHANDKINIKGGVIKIASQGDAIQSERGDSVIVSGGKILAKTTGIKSHGITSEHTVTIKGNARVQISVLGNGSKGIKSLNTTDVLSGTVKIKTSGGQDQNDADTSTSAGIKVGPGNGQKPDNLYIEGGSLEIRSTGSKAKGINTNGDIEMTNGNVTINATDDGIKVRGVLRMRGGSITVTSSTKDNIDGTISQTGGTINGR